MSGLLLNDFVEVFLLRIGQYLIFDDLRID